jgi:aminobenzoyl-glutamate utilization protein B
MTELEFVKAAVDAKAEQTIELSKEIWEFAELAYEETKSAGALSAALKKEGFSVTTGIAQIPTSIRAEYKSGSGRPVVGILGEYDALDCLSQKAACPEKSPIVPDAPGHGCGHNLLGAGSFAAAVAIKDYLKETGRDGTVVFFGCPAEEGAGSKQFIARAGYFDDVDFVYTWHPASINEIPAKGEVAIIGANFTFDGVAAHAGSSPHLGRSALDAAELMNVGVNYLREHMPDAARVHYAYSDAGGTQPNVVPSHAVIKYEVRAPKVAGMQELFARVVNIAKGAALMTETQMKYEVTMAFSDYLPSKTLAGVAEKCFQEVGAPEWTDEDCALAAEFMRTYSKNTVKSIREELEEYYAPEELDEVLKKPLDFRVRPFNYSEKVYVSGSTDVGDVGYAVPTLSIDVATACLVNVGHSWQNTAFSNSAIGYKGMLTAAKVMALAALRTMDSPETIEKAKAELLVKNGGRYVCPLPDYCNPPVGRY